MKQKLFILCLLGPFCLFAQEKFKIIYNYSTDEVRYYAVDKDNKVTDTLEKPRFKRNSIIQVEVQDVNPFALRVETEVTEEDIHNGGSNFNFGSMLGGIQSVSGSGLSLNTENLPTGDIMNLKDNASRGAAQRGVEDLQNLTVSIAALKRTIAGNMQNPNLSKAQIEQNILDLALQIDDPRLPDPEENLYLFLESLESLVVTGANTLNNEMNRGGTDISTNNSLQRYTTQTVTAVNEVKGMFTALEASSFTQSYDYRVEKDRANFELRFMQGEFIQGTTRLLNADQPQKIRSIPIYAKGGFKINTGVALTLNNFGDNSLDYYIDQDGLIDADSNDSFVPNLSTMINFYPVIGDNFNIGGSFGLSIPITGDLSGINFLLGPSLFLGNSNRLSLSGGLALGPVQSLTNGLEIGNEAIGSDIESFTENVYDFGYYFGISFSLFDIKQ
ncbi:hypothetical protein [Dokdonia sp. Asnod1-B02]|uniref:hypothetical protein n=1 Tax=Dokdonia sp. Asnod1-B02 TaxID=3160573 RepID=UPI00386326AB